ncbi:MAG: TM0106 family RecB-like putative nuclease [Firmicutes bacterium]|nr:TM0106 family RecB-like putative nuclease [Alicyclobacillaceae bacterium]MCL6496157.1 TM0106 family RecB-like putative nuclease [Bacillota bacterium]
MAGSARWWTATDLVDFLACPHRLAWVRWAEAGRIAGPPAGDDTERAMVQALAGTQEAAAATRFEAQGRAVARIPGDGDPAAQAAATAAAMRAGAPVIAQGVLLDPPWFGRPDFLVRVEGASDLGPWHYEVWDATLAHHPRVLAWAQTAFDSLLLDKIQGRRPASMALILGTGAEERLPVAHADAFVERARRRLLAAATAPLPDALPCPDRIAACGECRWQALCDAQRRAADHLSLVADIRRDQIRKLRQAGVRTLADLAAWDPARPVPGIGAAPLERLVRQARLQHRARETGAPCWELLPPAPGRGLARLPEPDPGDVFFALEGDPWAAGGQREYLWGWGYWDEDGAWQYRCLWGHTPEGEQVAFAAFIDWVMARWTQHQGMHVYHYNHDYNHDAVDALQRLAGRHGTREAAVDRLLRGEVLVDLYRVVREAVQVSEASYAIEALEHRYRGAGRTTAVQKGGASVAAYRRWLATGDDALLAELARYNADDCRSTAECRAWLEGLRAAAGIAERPPRLDPTPSEAVEAQERAAQEVAAAAAVGRGPQADLLARCCGWHRREDRVAWQAFYRRRAGSPEAWWDDPEAIAHLEHLERAPAGSRAVADAYAFPAEQEVKIRVGDTVVDPETGREAGVLQALDLRRGRLVLRRPAHHESHPLHLIAGGPVDTRPLQRAVHRVALALAADPGAHPALAALLARTPPRFAHGAALPAPGSDPVAEAVALALRLDQSYLAVQGPPGTGKTYLGGRVVAALLRAGHTVGVTGPSHLVIRNLLAAIKGAWGPEPLPGVRVGGRSEAPAPGEPVPVVTGSEAGWRAFRQGARLVAGTAWVFARAEWDRQLDYLVVDEAGQFALADTLAVGGAARNLILLGDPQQLPHPVQAHHPDGVAVSALGHLLAGRPTMPPDLGLFLPVTRRCHPAIADYLGRIAYGGRLGSAEHCGRQTVLGPAPWGGAGLRWVEVPHQGHRTTAPEEVETVAAIVDQLLRCRWREASGRERALAPADILVVAPFNAQVHRLQAALPEGVQAGTVDRFQGQEAPVVLYSLTASDPDHLPHGQAFLFNLHRINVAISRAQGLAVLVGSPALLDALPAQPEALPGVNALCAFVQEAQAAPRATG